MAGFIFTASALLLWSFLGQGIRRGVQRKVKGIAPVLEQEPELKVLGGDVKQDKPLRVEVKEDLWFSPVQWVTGELVGYVHEGHIVKVGDHGALKSCRRTNDVYYCGVQFSNGTEYLINELELYRVVASKYGLRGGQRAHWIAGANNSGNIHQNQPGVVTAFDVWNPPVLWYDLRQRKLFAVEPEWIRGADPYGPERGAGAWVPLHTVWPGSEIKEMVGTEKTRSETKEKSWSDSVTRTLSLKMSAGVEFNGLSAGIEVGAELSSTMSRAHASSVSYSWTQNTESSYTLPFQADGYLWQWEVRTQLKNSDVMQSRTRNFAVTAGRYQRPRCLPGYQTDGKKHQTCLNSDSTLDNCPSGSVQVGPHNADIRGCGLSGCDNRYQWSNAQECRAWCATNSHCKAFTWAPKGGDQNHKGQTVCTLYNVDAPTGLWGSNQYFCKLV